MTSIKYRYNLCILCLFLLKSWLSDAAFQYHDVDRLLSHLFNTTRYKAYIRPVREQSIPTQVNISLTLTSIQEFDLSSGSLLSTGYLQITWLDELLVWEPHEFGGISQLNIPNEYNWKPGLAFSRSLEEESPTSSAIFGPTWVSNNGKVIMFSAGHFQTVCELDTTHYPFDGHTCNYQIISTNYDISEVVIHSTEQSINMEEFLEHGEWFVKYSICRNEKMSSKANSFQLSALSNVIRIKRRSAFVFLHALCPLFLLDALCIVVCLVPVDSGERISYSVTVFLSFMFLSGSILMDLPRNSLKIAALSIELCIVNILSTLNVLWSVYIVRLIRRHGDERSLPQFLKCANDLMQKISKPIHKRPTMISCKALDEGEDSVSQDDPESVCQKLSKNEQNVGEENIKMKWLETIRTLDLVYFFINLIVYIVMGLVMMGIFVTNYNL